MLTATIRTIDSGEPTISTIDCVVAQDKSILHRILVLAAISRSVISVPILLPIVTDVRTTINALRALGVSISEQGDVLIIHGVGPTGFRQPSTPIDCENSGTTARFLIGLLSGQSFDSELIGDPSLSIRPMQRLAILLNEQLGASIVCSPNDSLPVSISGRKLRAAEVTLPVASAQLKTALLLAAMVSQQAISIREPIQSRDHTERMFQGLGIDVACEERLIRLRQSSTGINGGSLQYIVPGDISSAAFFLVAAAILRIDITIRDVGLNPTRTAFLDVLSNAGVPIFYSNVATLRGERRGTITVSGSQISKLRRLLIGSDLVPNLQDEIPVLAVYACFADGTSVISGAGELRHKESDRIRAIATNLTRFGVSIRERPDGLEIDGRQELVPKGCQIDHFGDHRIAMAMSIAALRAPAEVTIPDASVVSISFTTFYDQLQEIAAAAGKTITVV